MKASIKKNGTTLHPDLMRRLFHGASWGVLGAVAVNGITLIAMIFVARILGAENYGRFIVVQATLNMVGVFAAFGTSAAATQFVAEYKVQDVARLGRLLSLAQWIVFVLGFISALGLVIASDFLATHLLGSPQLGETLTIAAISVWFLAIDAFQKGVIIGLEAMRSFAISSALATAMSIPLMILLVFFYGLRGGAVGLVLISLFQCVVSRVQMNFQLKSHKIFTTSRGNVGEWRVVRDIALPSLIAGLLVQPVHWICQTLLARTGSGYFQLALLGMAMHWFNAILFLPQVAGRVVLPILAERIGSKNRNDALQILKLSILASSLVAICVAIPIVIASPFITAAYGPNFVSQWKPLALAAGTAILVVASSPLGQFLAARKQMWIGVAINFLWSAIFVGAAYQLYVYGALGIILALAIAYFFHSILSLTYVYLVRAETDKNELITS